MLFDDATTTRKIISAKDPLDEVVLRESQERLDREFKARRGLIDIGVGGAAIAVAVEFLNRIGAEFATFIGEKISIGINSLQVIGVTIIVGVVYYVATRAWWQGDDAIYAREKGRLAAGRK
jgi:hypothetical protein